MCARIDLLLFVILLCGRFSQVLLRQHLLSSRAPLTSRATCLPSLLAAQPLLVASTTPLQL
jgi:hypothetical protein